MGFSGFPSRGRVLFTSLILWLRSFLSYSLALWTQTNQLSRNRKYIENGLCQKCYSESNNRHSPLGYKWVGYSPEDSRRFVQKWNDVSYIYDNMSCIIIKQFKGLFIQTWNPGHETRFRTKWKICIGLCYIQFTENLRKCVFTDIYPLHIVSIYNCNFITKGSIA